MELTLIQDTDGLLSTRDTWNQLTSEPLSSWDWNFAWWQQLADDCELRVLVATKDERVVGIAPFCICSRGGEKSLRFLGHGSTCTDYAKLICLPEFEREFQRAVADEIMTAGGLLAKASVVQLEGVLADAGDEFFSDQLRSAYWRYDRELDSSWVLALQDDWDEFLANRGRGMRRKIRKAVKRYANGEAVLKSTLSELQLEEAFDILVQLHQQRFESKGMPGVFADVRFERFLRQAVGLLAARGRAEIIVCEIKDRPIAAQLYLLGNSGPQLYQSGICPDSGSYEPGHLLFSQAIRRAIADGHSTFDFLRGNEPYKSQWGASPVPLKTMFCVSRRIPTTVKHQLLRSLRQLKSATINSALSLGLF